MNSLSAAQREFSKSRELVEPSSEISPHPSFPPSAIPAPGSRSRQGICCWSCAAAPLSLTHTHTEGTAAPRPPSERHRQEKSHLPSQCCSSQVLFQVIPTAQASEERIETQQCPPCPGSALPISPGHEAGNEKRKKQREISHNFLQNNNPRAGFAAAQAKKKP